MRFYQQALLLSLILSAVSQAAHASARWLPSFFFNEAMMASDYDYLSSGYEEERVLYVCRARAHMGLHPGKLVDGKCNIGYGGAEEVYDKFDVYTGSGQWSDKIMLDLDHPGVVIGGYESDRHLAICLASAHSGWHPGKVVGGKCNIGYGGAEEVYSDFKVLVE